MLREGLLRAAIALARPARNVAYRLYVLGFGFADLSGYCGACIRTLRAHGPRVLPLSQDANWP